MCFSIKTARPTVSHLNLFFKKLIDLRKKKIKKGIGYSTTLMIFPRSKRKTDVFGSNHRPNVLELDSPHQIQYCWPSSGNWQVDAQLPDNFPAVPACPGAQDRAWHLPLLNFMGFLFIHSSSLPGKSIPDLKN